MGGVVGFGVGRGVWGCLGRVRGWCGAEREGRGTLWVRVRLGDGGAGEWVWEWVWEGVWEWYAAWA